MEPRSEVNAEGQVAQARRLGFDFRGDGMEYFKIWIVNLLLTILTLGIYSAWATVRTNRYFYANLYLDDSNFRYLAEPLTILKGRLIAVVVFIVYSLLVNFNPLAGLTFALVLMLFMPHFINQSLAFKYRMSAYKNIQFRFSATYREAFKVFFMWPILGILTLGILYPMAILKANQYLIKNSAYGTTKFDFSATFKDYGMLFLIMLGILFMLMLTIGILTYVASALGFNAGVETIKGTASVAVLGFYLWLFLYFTVQSTRILYANLSLLDHRFESTITMTDFGMVILKNVFFTIITLGLYLPAAKVRLAKYMASCTVMHATGSLDHFAAAEAQNVGALGEELGQVFDFGV